jgi:hypothetical protein
MLAVDPLDVDHVKQCNQVEADFWKHNEGYQTKNSDKLLQFDCGGQVGFVTTLTDRILLLLHSHFLSLTAMGPRSLLCDWYTRRKQWKRYGIHGEAVGGYRRK